MEDKFEIGTPVSYRDAPWAGTTQGLIVGELPFKDNIVYEILDNDGSYVLIYHKNIIQSR